MWLFNDSTAPDATVPSWDSLVPSLLMCLVPCKCAGFQPMWWPLNLITDNRQTPFPNCSCSTSWSWQPAGNHLSQTDMPFWSPGGGDPNWFNYLGFEDDKSFSSFMYWCYSVLKPVSWREVITSRQPGVAFESVEADIYSCWAPGQCTLIHGREKCHCSQINFVLMLRCVCHSALSISITHKERALRAWPPCTAFLQFLIYQTQDICSCLAMALWNRQLKAPISCQIFQGIERLYHSHNNTPSKGTCG